jgi:ABC-type glycerol-3-phosphate transport system permease component
MAILSQIGRRSLRVRLFLGAIYTALALGAVTMIYPLLILVSGSTKSAVDLKDTAMIPAFLHHDEALYRKHIEGLFNESVEAMNNTYDSDVPSFELVRAPARASREMVGEWLAFLEAEKLPDYFSACGYLAAGVTRTIPQNLREFKRYVAKQYGSDIADVNAALGTDFVGWNAFFVLPENYAPRVSMPQNTPLAATLNDFKKLRPQGALYYHAPEGFFKRQYLSSVYSRDIADYNNTHGTHYGSYAEVHLSRRLPQGTAREQADWEAFVREHLNLLWIRVDEGARPAYHGFLKAKYRNIDVLNRHYGASYNSFSEVPLMAEPPLEGLALSDWAAVLSGWKDPDTGIEYRIPADQLRVHSIEFLFRDYLRKKYGDIGALNGKLGTAYRRFLDILPPQKDAHYFSFLESRKALRREFVTRNYLTVLDYLFFHGRGILNTAIYCSLAVLFALLVNPLAAYALSRYRLPSAYKILLFLMLTMAFPSMVTQIPVFLMLRKLHLLNTFAALILPGLANGYSIFLLKGFFDSLPRDLYETASLDGAGEWTMFWRITMSLSTPVLSVIALQAFMAAYANFMYALLICQDEKMWTLMVWLYQLQDRSGQAVMYASLLIAAIPTFILFVLCQKVIMRGIVVPVEK